MKLVEILANYGGSRNDLTYTCSSAQVICTAYGFHSHHNEVIDDWLTARVTNDDIEAFKKTADKVMTSQANGISYETYVNGGWTDAELVKHGCMAYREPKPLKTFDDNCVKLIDDRKKRGRGWWGAGDSAVLPSGWVWKDGGKHHRYDWLERESDGCKLYFTDVWPEFQKPPVHVEVKNHSDKPLNINCRCIPTPVIETTTAPDLLNKSAELLKERGKQYDKSGSERSMPKVINAFNTITGRDLTAQEGWLLMQLLKMVRIYQNPENVHQDSLEDLIAYAALHGEEWLR